jgi:hypothetical protein
MMPTTTAAPVQVPSLRGSFVGWGAVAGVVILIEL